MEESINLLVIIGHAGSFIVHLMLSNWNALLKHTIHDVVSDSCGTNNKDLGKWFLSNWVSSEAHIFSQMLLSWFSVTEIGLFR